MSSSMDETLLGEDSEPTAGRGNAPLARGDVVGRYVVLGNLGAGGMGVVYAAYDPELDRKVALKLLHGQPKDQSKASEGRKRLVREAQAMARLSHPNVITVHDVGLHQQQVFLAMEFIDGETLASWLEKDRTWQDVLEVLSHAGTGLLAAHQKGLVHRDFKPDNVMIAKDGRVRVMDFGLAHSDEDETVAESASTREDGFQTPGTDALAGALTRHGAMIGTPAYMAPEQWLGEATDARTDQFSFCVVLYEALYGQRPFAGEGSAGLALQVTEGKVREPPSSRAPSWIKKIVLRGLSARPAERFESMHELLAELSRGQAWARTRKLVMGLAAVVVLGVGAEGYRRYDEAQTVATCEAAGEQISEIWNEDTRASVRDALRATGVGYAEQTAEKVLPYFDTHAEAWKSARTEACMDARVRETWDEDVLARSNWCLEIRRMQLGALATELGQAEVEGVQRAVLAAATLSPVAPCRDAEWLRALPPPPEASEAVMAVREQLSRVRALDGAGKYEEALKLAEEAHAAADELAWPPVAANARSWEGASLERLGRYAEAEKRMEDAYFEAREAGALQVALHTSLSLVTVVGERLARAPEGKEWAQHARVLLATLEPNENGLQHAELMNDLGSVYLRTGEYEQAVGLYIQALEIRETNLGPQHPAVGETLHNLGAIYHLMGKYDLARENLERAIVVRQNAFGDEHPYVGESLLMLGNVDYAAHDLEAAKRSYGSALSNLEAALGPDHPTVAKALNNQGLVLRAANDLEGARELYQRSLAIREKVLGPDHADLGGSLVNLALIQFALEDYEQAEALNRRALAIWEATLGPDHPHLAHPLQGLADIASKQGRPADAIPFCERGLRLREQNQGSPTHLAETRERCADALWEAPEGKGRDRARARKLATAARDTFAQTEGYDDERKELEKWLKNHGGLP